MERTLPKEVLALEDNKFYSLNYIAKNKLIHGLSYDPLYVRVTKLKTLKPDLIHKGLKRQRYSFYGATIKAINKLSEI